MKNRDRKGLMADLTPYLIAQGVGLLAWIGFSVILDIPTLPLVIGWVIASEVIIGYRVYRWFRGRSG
jgi:hypothetical protein